MISHALWAGVISSAPPPIPPTLTGQVSNYDGGIESLIYLAFRSKITAALQANVAKVCFIHYNFVPSATQFLP